MDKMSVVSLDPGLTGGLAFFDITADSGAVELVGSERMPTCLTTRYKTKPTARRIDVIKVAEMINAFNPVYAFTELVSAMPARNSKGVAVQGATSTFNFGLGTGYLEGTLFLLGLPVQWIQPAAWKRYHGLINTEKKEAVYLAHKYWPEVGFTKTTADSGRADAALLGFYGIQKYINEIIGVI